MNTKLVAALIFLGALAIGMVAGIFIDRALFQSSAPPYALPRVYDRPPDAGVPMMRHFAQTLDLTTAQQSELDRVLENYRQRLDFFRHSMHPRYAAMRDSLHADIRKILTPEQQKKFDEMSKNFQVGKRRTYHKPRYEDLHRPPPSRIEPK
jgi:Spy/CpxP family protein refolding chaperone